MSECWFIRISSQSGVDGGGNGFYLEEIWDVDGVLELRNLSYVGIGLLKYFFCQFLGEFSVGDKLAWNFLFLNL